MDDSNSIAFRNPPDNNRYRLGVDAGGAWFFGADTVDTYSVSIDRFSIDTTGQLQFGAGGDVAFRRDAADDLIGDIRPGAVDVAAARFDPGTAVAERYVAINADATGFKGVAAPAGGGDITEVTAGDGLTGGGTSGAVTLAVAGALADRICPPYAQGDAGQYCRVDAGGTALEIGPLPHIPDEAEIIGDVRREEAQRYIDVLEEWSGQSESQIEAATFSIDGTTWEFDDVAPARSGGLEIDFGRPGQATISDAALAAFLRYHLRIDGRSLALADGGCALVEQDRDLDCQWAGVTGITFPVDVAIGEPLGAENYVPETGTADQCLRSSADAPARWTDCPDTTGALTGIAGGPGIRVSGSGSTRTVSGRALAPRREDTLPTEGVDTGELVRLLADEAAHPAARAFRWRASDQGSGFEGAYELRLGASGTPQFGFEVVALPSSFSGPGAGQLAGKTAVYLPAGQITSRPTSVALFPDGSPPKTYTVTAVTGAAQWFVLDGTDTDYDDLAFTRPYRANLIGGSSPTFTQDYTAGLYRRGGVGEEAWLSSGGRSFILMDQPDADVDFTTSNTSRGSWQTLATLPALTADQAGLVSVHAHVHAEVLPAQAATDGAGRYFFEMRMLQGAAEIAHADIYGPRNLNLTNTFGLQTRKADGGFHRYLLGAAGDVFALQARAISQYATGSVRFTRQDTIIELAPIGP